MGAILLNELTRDLGCIVFTVQYTSFMFLFMCKNIDGRPDDVTVRQQDSEVTGSCPKTMLHFLPPVTVVMHKRAVFRA